MMDEQELTPKQWAAVLLVAALVHSGKYGASDATAFAKTIVKEISKETKDG